MVTVIFYHLLRSKYGIHQIEVSPGTINEILIQIKKIHSQIDLKDFQYSVAFINKVKIVHPSKFDEIIKDGDKVVFTHFVGGG